MDQFSNSDISSKFDDMTLDHSAAAATSSMLAGFGASPPLPSASGEVGDAVTEEMECPHVKVGMVIGSKGVIIQEIMHRTHCKIVIIQDGLPDGEPRKVVITGSPSNIENAKMLITTVINEGPAALQSSAPGLDPSEPTETEEMICPQEKVGLVIGAKGVIIQDIMRRSCCRITVNQNFPDGEPRMVVITGKPTQIEIAKSLVALVIANGPGALNQSGVVGNSANAITDEMDCPQEKVGIVIGAKGVIVQEIMRRCGCKIVIHQDFPDGHPRKVVLTGSPQQVEAGKNIVSAVIAHGPGVVQGTMGGGGAIVQDMKIMQSQVGKLIGPGGSTIKDIQQRCGVKMNIDQISPNTDERRLRITGDGRSVQAATGMVWHVLHSHVGGGMMGGHQMGGPHSGYGMPMMNGYNDGGGMMHHHHHPGYGYAPQPPVQSGPGGYGMQPPMGGEMPPQQVQTSVGQGLGADGSSGRLMPATPTSNGMMHQIVYVLVGLVSRITGDNFATLALIMAKSGANVQIEPNPVIATGGQEMCKINVVGNSQGVGLAGQMIQEVLINGPDKLTTLPDAPNLFGFEGSPGGGGAQAPPAQTGQTSPQMSFAQPPQQGGGYGNGGFSGQQLSGGGSYLQQQQQQQPSYQGGQMGFSQQRSDGDRGSQGGLGGQQQMYQQQPQSQSSGYYMQQQGQSQYGGAGASGGGMFQQQSPPQR